MTQQRPPSATFIYQLTPRKLEDPIWKMSRVKETVWVRASLDNDARAKVAGATIMASSPQKRGEKLPTSPWYLAEFSECTLVTSCPFDLGDKPTTADGHTLPRH